MKVLSLIGLVCSSVGSIALLSYVAMFFAFQGEGSRGSKVPDIQGNLQLLSFLISLVPVCVTGYLFYWWVKHSKSPSVLISFLPLGLALLCGLVSSYLFEEGAQLGTPGRARAYQEGQVQIADQIKTLREKVENGLASACELLALDPKANYSDFKKCRVHITNLSAIKDRIRECAYILSPNFSWVIGTSSRDGTEILSLDDEQWFLRLVFSDYLADIEKLGDEDSMTRLRGFLSSLVQGFSNLATAMVVKEFLPKLEERLRSEAHWDDSTFTYQHKTFLNDEKNRNNLIAKSWAEAKKYVKMMGYLDLATERLRPKLESKGLVFKRTSYGRNVYDIFSEFTSNHGDNLKIIVYYWYPSSDESNPDYEPQMAAEWVKGNSNWNSRSIPEKEIRQKLNFQFSSSRSEIERAIDSLYELLIRNQ